MGRLATALGVSAGLLAAIYVAACVLPGEPSNAERIQFSLDFPVPYRVPLAGVVEPLITISAAGQAVTNPAYRLESLDPSVVRVDSTERRLFGVTRGTASMRVTYLGATGTPDTVFPVQVAISRVAVDSPALAFSALGVRTRLSAIALDANNAAVPNVPFTWSSADPTVAAVNDTGLVTAMDEGATTIIAEADDVADSSHVTVTQVAAQVRLLPELDTLHTVGRSVQFLAIAFDDTGGAIRTARPRWSSSNASVARVDSAGVATATGGGKASIVAQVGTAADTATLVVAQVARLLVVTPGLDTLTAIRDTGRIVAIASDSLGNPIPNPTVTWVTSDTTIATVDAAGLATALVANGVVLVTASSAGQSAFATIVVQQAVAAAQLSTDRVALVGEGDTVRLSALGLDKNGYPVAGAWFAWHGPAGCVASVVTATGTSPPFEGTSALVTARGAGETVIIATPYEGGQSDTAAVSVTGAPAGEAEIAFSSYLGIEALCSVGFDRAVLIPNRATGDSGFRAWGPAWSPDGASLAFFRVTSESPPDCGIYIARADGSQVHRVADGCSRPAWSPDGTKLAFAKPNSDTIYVVNTDGSNVRPLFAFGPGRWVSDPTWSPDGTRLAFTGYWPDFAHCIFVMNADGSGAVCLGGTSLGSQPAWSPDGSQLAITRANSAVGSDGSDIWLINPDGSGARNLTSRGYQVFAHDPAWSPDGSRLVFTELNGPPDWMTDSYYLNVINRDGTGLQQLTFAGYNPHGPAWRPAAPPP